MFNKLSPIGIDISDTSIEMAQVRFIGVKRAIFALGRIKLPPEIIENGAIIDEELLKQKIKLLFKKSLPQSFSGRKVRLTIPAKRTFSDIFQISKQTLKRNIKSSLENLAQSRFPINIKNYTLVYNQLNSADDFIRYHLAAIPTRLINQYKAFFLKLGFSIEEIDLEALSLGRSLIRQQPKSGQAILILDIGAKTTDLHIFNKSGLIWSSTLNLGGDFFSQDISQKMPVSLKQGEIFKRQYGFLADKQQGKIVNILQACFQPIISHLNAAIHYYQGHYQDRIKQLIISGGSALIPGVAEYLADNSSLETVLANPLIKFRFKKWPAQWPPMFFSNALGLCLWDRKTKFQGCSFITQKITKHTWCQWTKRLLLIIGLLVIIGSSLTLIRPKQITIEPSPAAKIFELRAVGFLGNDLSQLNSEIKKSLDSQVITILPARQLNIENTLTKECLASGISDQIAKAQGKITILNNTADSQTLVEKTRLVSEQKVLFRFNEKLVIPANSQKEVLVMADAAGEAGNIGPSLFVIPGLNQDLQESIFGQSDKAMAGGGEKMHFIQQKDIDLCLSTLDQEMTRAAINQLNQQTSPQEVLIQQPIKQTTINQNLPHINELAMSFKTSLQKQMIFATLDKQVLELFIAQNQSDLNKIVIVVDKSDLENQLIYLIIKLKVES